MPTVTLVFEGDFADTEIYSALSGTESGFLPDRAMELDDLHASAELVLAITGVVLNAAQLAVAISQLRSSADAGPRIVKVLVVGGDANVLTEMSEAEVLALLAPLEHRGD